MVQLNYNYTLAFIEQVGQMKYLLLTRILRIFQLNLYVCPN